MKMHAFNLLPLTLSLPALSTTQSTPVSKNGLTTWEQIHRTLNTYPPAVDFKQPSLFPSVFTDDVQANYTGPLSNLTGLPALRDALLLSVSTMLSQHQLGTTLIDIASGEESANSTTYFTATLWSIAPETQGDYTILFGFYRDDLLLTDQGWRINKRDLVFMGPSLGNLTLGG